MNEDVAHFLVRVFERLPLESGLVFSLDNSEMLVQLRRLNEKFRILQAEFEFEETEAAQGASVMREHALSLFYFSCAADGTRLDRIREKRHPGHERYVELENLVRSMI